MVNQETRNSTKWISIGTKDTPPQNLPFIHDAPIYSEYRASRRKRRNIWEGHASHCKLWWEKSESLRHYSCFYRQPTCVAGHSEFCRYHHYLRWLLLINGCVILALLQLGLGSDPGTGACVLRQSADVSTQALSGWHIIPSTVSLSINVQLCALEMTVIFMLCVWLWAWHWGKLKHKGRNTQEVSYRHSAS